MLRVRTFRAFHAMFMHVLYIVICQLFNAQDFLALLVLSWQLAMLAWIAGWESSQKVTFGRRDGKNQRHAASHRFIYG